VQIATVHEKPETVRVGTATTKVDGESANAREN
jgi:hypothetical protein